MFYLPLASVIYWVTEYLPISKKIIPFPSLIIGYVEIASIPQKWSLLIKSFLSILLQ